MKSSRRIIALGLSLLLVCLSLSGCGKAADSDRPAEPPEEPAPAAPTPASLVSSDIVISEFMEKNKAVLPDEDGDFSDWAELYNAGGETVCLAGWHLSDKENKSGWEFSDVSIAPGEYLLIFLSGKDRCGAELHTDFSLNGSEELYLRAPDGSLICQAPCGDCAGDVAMACIGGVWQPTLYPTPGEENSHEGYRFCQETLSAPGPLVISEAVVYGLSDMNSGLDEAPDWVEIKNISDKDVQLSDYWLSDDDDNYRKYRLPRKLLPAGEYALFLCHDAPENYRGKLNYTGFSLDAGEEQLYLAANDGTLLDYASLRDIPCGGSFGRMDGENGWFFFESPSPLTANTDGRRRIAQTPVSLTDDGVFNGSDRVRVELAGEGEIHYTLDGSRPTAGSPLYTAPLELDSTCVVRAVSLADDSLCSRPLTLNFIINENHTLPVFCLTTDEPASFRRMYDGMHKGEEQSGTLSLYKPDGGFTIGCGVSLNGETSLVEAKKNLSLRFRSVYGQDTLRYDIYGGGVTEFTNLLLRAGQDYKFSVIRNELAQSLCAMADCDVINQRSMYGILYINGEYSGIYSLKEKTNEQLYASIAGVSRESVELYEASVPYKSPLYQDVFHFALTNDMSLDENYEHICSLVDIDSLIDWAFMEGFCANTDLSSGNLRYCRSEEADGLWHLMFYDLDAAFRNENSMFYNTMTEYGKKHLQVSGLLVPLMENEQFRDRFLTRASGLLTDVLTNETVLAEIDRLAAEIAPEISRDHIRFSRSSDDWVNELDALRDLIVRRNWRQLNIEALSTVFDLSDAERAYYFGEIDGK